jgi:Tol biopolymer transport system component
VTSAGREAPQGINGNGSEGLAISPDGRYVYFTVDTEGFVRGDDRFGDGLADVVRKDMKTGELEIVSTSSSASGSARISVYLTGSSDGVVTIAA